MGKFFGRAGGVVFPAGLGRFGREPMAQPMPPGAAPVPPEAMPVGNALPYTPALRVPMIYPQVMGAPVEKSIVSPLWGDQTRASFLDRGAFTVPVPSDPASVPGARPLNANTVLQNSPPPLFLTPARAIAERLDNANVRALIAAKISNETQAKADAAAHAAGRAFTKAQMAPSPGSAGDAAAKARAAELADEAAARARAHASNEEQKANDLMLDQGYPDQYGPPGTALPGTTIPEYAVAPASSKGTLVAAGSAAAAGFMLGGPVGALVGALLGGVGYTYVKNH
jgi:hypothetical protein